MKEIISLIIGFLIGYGMCSVLTISSECSRKEEIERIKHEEKSDNMSSNR